MVWVKAFLAGFLSTLVFHQGVIALFWLAGVIPAAPWDMTPAPPFGVPKVISLAFWGGVWGVPVWWLVRRWRGASQWLAALVAGAVGPTAVAMLVVFPLKGLDVNTAIIIGGLIVNGAWGIGVVACMRWLFRSRG
jgi:hypothetical protein